MTEQSPNYHPRPAALRLAEFVKGWASAWPEFSGAHKSGMETAAELLRLHAENQALATGYAAARLEIESLQARAQELVAQLDAVGAGGVEPLRRAKCLHQIAEPKQKPVAFGSAEEFSSSDDPHCKNGGKACIDCLMRGECLHQTVEPVPEAAQEPMFWVRLTDSGGYEGPLHRSSIEDVHKKSGAWTPLYTEPQPPAVEPQPTPSNPGELKPDLANIDSPFNACMYQERCKRWRDAAARKQLTLEELADKWLSVRHIVHATDRQIAFARAIEAAHGITAPKPLWLPSDDTEGGAL